MQLVFYRDYSGAFRFGMHYGNEVIRLLVTFHQLGKLPYRPLINMGVELVKN